MSEVKPPYSVLIVEPDAGRRQMHALDVKRDADFAVKGAFAGKRDAAAFVNRNQVDFAVLNSTLSEGNAAELIRLIVKRNPQALVLVATEAGDDTTIMHMVSAGANGYVLLSDNKADIASCLKLMLSGGSPVSPAIARSVLRSLHCRAEMNKAVPENSPLSPRELDVMRLLSKGFGFQEIGSILAISHYTVTTHIKKIYRKLNVHSRDEAVYEAKQRGLAD